HLRTLPARARWATRVVISTGRTAREIDALVDMCSDRSATIRRQPGGRQKTFGIARYRSAPSVETHASPADLRESRVRGRRRGRGTLRTRSLSAERLRLD